MKKLLILAGLALGIASLSVPSGARNYDCTKAGNATKAACKSTSVAPASSPKAAKATSTKTTTTSASSRSYDCTKAGNKNKSACKTAAAPSAPTASGSARNYDCTKAGNANKAACKTAADPSGPASRKATQTTAAASYDCTKFYNKMRAVCRTQGSATKTNTSVAAPTPMARPAATQATARSANTIAVGASAQCKDGSFSHAQHRTGACSRHGGVAKWL